MNGVRLVPLHNSVYAKIMDFANGIDSSTKIFGRITNDSFTKAPRELAKELGVSEEYRIEHNISFYSGRHYWKTLMNAGGLGEDAEEVFMGHRVTNNVAKLYNHRDKQGQELLVQKAKEIFRILDTKLFVGGP